MYHGRYKIALGLAPRKTALGGGRQGSGLLERRGGRGVLFLSTYCIVGWGDGGFGGLLRQFMEMGGITPGKVASEMGTRWQRGR